MQKFGGFFKPRNFLPAKVSDIKVVVSVNKEIFSNKQNGNIREKFNCQKLAKV